MGGLSIAKGRGLGIICHRTAGCVPEFLRGAHHIEVLAHGSVVSAPALQVALLAHYERVCRGQVQTDGEAACEVQTDGEAVSRITQRTVRETESGFRALSSRLPIA
jgi:hypothetical protein